MTTDAVKNRLEGKSKARNFLHNECAELWARGIWDVRSGENLTGYIDELIHYNTLSAIRTHKGDVIVNTQDWGAGFAKQPSFPSEYVKAHLPLTTLRGSSLDIKSIEVIEEVGWNSCLFKIAESYFLFGNDEGQRFIVELVEPCKTVDEAIESMKPESIKMVDKFSDDDKKKWPVVRQGDLFFIGNPSAVDNDPVSFPHSYQQAYMRKLKDDRYEFNPVTNEGYRGKSYRWYPQIKRDGEPSRHGASKIIETDNAIGLREFDGIIQQVTGQIKHPQHKTLKLKGWWVVIPNRVKRSITVEARGGGGVD